jgi:HEAT repeat protein
LPRKPDVEELRKDRDLEKLMAVLRYPADAQVRAQAARALGELNDSQAVESLIRSTQLDPSAEVQSAARSALEEMFGNRAASIIAAYPIYQDEEPWIAAAQNDGDEEDDQEEDIEDDEVKETQEDDAPDDSEGWDMDDLGPLVTILRGERDPHLRLKAARALGKLGSNNIHAVEALAVTALWGESPSVRAAALQALVKIYGDEEAEQVINTFREMQTGQAEPETAQEEGEEELDEETEENDASQWDRQPQALPQPIPYSQTEPVIRDEGAGRLRQVVWIGIIILVIIGMVALFTYFK